MSHDTCILTAKDFTIIEVMLERCPGPDEPRRALLARKVAAASVVFQGDVPPDVATLNSRVSFRVDDRPAATRIISHDRMNAPVGLFLPVTTLRGLALLGLSEGQPLRFDGPGGAVETVLLQSVDYQPEAARRERERLLPGRTPGERRNAFRVIAGGGIGLSPGAVDDFDNPGPSAA